MFLVYNTVATKPLTLQTTTPTVLIKRVSTNVRPVVFCGIEELALADVSVDIIQYGMIDVNFELPSKIG